MVFNATFNNISVISWRSVLLVEETRVPGENLRPVAGHWQTLSHNVVSSIPRLVVIRTHNFSDDGYCIGCCRSHYHSMGTTAPSKTRLNILVIIVVVLKCGGNTCVETKFKVTKRVSGRHKSDKKTNNDQQTLQYKTKDRGNTNPSKNQGCTRVLRKSEQFLLRMWHPSLWTF